MAFSTRDHLPPVLSRPVKCHWAGWETDTFRLQQAGWKLSAEQDVCRRTMRLALRHDQWGIEGLTELADEWHYGGMGHDFLDHVHLPMRIRAMGVKVFVQDHGPFDFQPIDAAPTWRDRAVFFQGEQVRPLQELAHFAPAPLVRTEALVLPEPDVDALLAMILEKQQAAKTGYFHDLVAREGQGMPAHKFHAQIISLAA